MLAVQDADSVLVIDCGGDVVHRLLAAGIAIDEIDGIIITHEHPDHVSGFPLFMEKIWLAGRKRPIPVYGLSEALSQANRCLSAFNTSGWDLPTMVWYEIAHESNASVLENDTWGIRAAPGVHGVPVVGLRIESWKSGGVVVYSSDTEPCDAIAGLSAGANILIHEATGDIRGHTSITDAAGLAERAGVGDLVLVHLPQDPDEEELNEARNTFSSIRLGKELERIPF